MKKSRFLRSLNVKLVMIMSSVMLPLMAFLIYNVFYATQIVRNQVSDSYRYMASSYILQIDNELKEVDKYLSYLQGFSSDLQIMEYSSTETDAYTLAKVRLHLKMKEEITRFSSISSILVYSRSKGNFLEILNGEASLEMRESLKKHVLEVLIDQGTGSNSMTGDTTWSVQRINGEYELIRTLQMGDLSLVAIGNFMNLSNMMNRSVIAENSALVLMTAQGMPITHEELFLENNLQLKRDLQGYHLQGGSTKFIIVGAGSSMSDFSLIALIPDDSILERLPTLQRAIIVISFILITLLPMSLILLRKVIWMPVRELVTAMRKVEQGDLVYRISSKPSSEEFVILNRSFNNMMDQMNKLTIDIYEEKINRQKFELEHLKLQIKPHFFLNSLNIIYTLARSKNFKVIQELTYCLIEYFRFMFKSDMEYVMLKEELKHVRNYIQIQELRMPGSLIYEERVPDFLKDTLVPPLIIHTFVENTLKYAVTLNFPINLTVAVQLVEAEPHPPMLKITIHDTGKGFDEGILEKLQKEERIIDENREHIGIRNIQQRLKLQYKGRAGIGYGNAETGGALVEIFIPMEDRKFSLEGSDV